MTIATEIMMNWSLVQSFLAVLDAGSLLAAARKLGTTQPTVGRHIEALEEQLGLLLFDRTARGLVPTANAHRVAPAARQMQRSATQLAAISASQQQPDKPVVVRISASEMVALHVLPELVRRLSVQAPAIRLAVVASDLQTNLLQRDADIAVRMLRPQQQSLIARRLGEVPLVACAAQAHIDRWGLPRTVEEMFRQPLVMPDRDAVFRQAIKALPVPFEQLHFALQSDSVPLQWQGICMGLGVGVAAQYMIERTPHVHALPLKLPVRPLPVWLAVHRELRTSPPIRLVFDFLARELAAITS